MLEKARTLPRGCSRESFEAAIEPGPEGEQEPPSGPVAGLGVGNSIPPAGLRPCEHSTHQEGRVTPGSACVPSAACLTEGACASVSGTSPRPGAGLLCRWAKGVGSRGPASPARPYSRAARGRQGTLSAEPVLLPACQRLRLRGASAARRRGRAAPLRRPGTKMAAAARLGWGAAAAAAGLRRR